MPALLTRRTASITFKAALSAQSRLSIPVRTITMSKPAFTLGTAKVNSSKPLETSDAKWLGLRMIEWTDEEGKDRKWEAADRKTRKGSIDAVAILALLSHPERPLSTVLIQQYRPPVECVVVELPAGLVDEGEKPEEAAVRELYEETGYGKGGDGGEAKVESVSPIMVNDPGMSSANMSLVTLVISLPSSRPSLDPPKPAMEAGEHIVTEVVPLSALKSKLEGYAKKDGWSVDARLMHLAEGLSISAKTQL